MLPDFIRFKFMEKYGDVKYKEFVLSLYLHFPRRDTLLFWQERLIKELLIELGIQEIEIEEIYNVFNHCPVHDIELLKDNVPIVDGVEYIDPINWGLQEKLFPLVNINALRDLNSSLYPRTIELLFCPSCRQSRSINLFY
jgi:hypothetical protein